MQVQPHAVEDDNPGVLERLLLYRSLQLLTTGFNEVMSTSIFFQFSLAFFIQTAANFGAIRFYGEVSLQSWLAYPVLAIVGSVNLFEIEAHLGSVYENAVVNLSSWRRSDIFATRRMTRSLKSCKDMKLWQGGFSFSDKMTCVTFHYSEFHFTINLLLG